MKIAIVGTGYVGLVTAAVFASKDHQLYCIDIDQNKIDNLKKGIIPFFEPGLDDLIKTSLQEGSITFTNDYSIAIPQADIVFICVGTPKQSNGNADLSYLEAAFASIIQHIEHFTIIVIKSTVPINSHIKIMKDLHIDTKKVELASCPEFLREGNALSDAFNPDRIIIGSSSDKVTKTLLKLFEDFQSPKLVTDIVSAQVIKYAANSFLATKISYANMIAHLCESISANGIDVLKGIGYDPRIGDRFLKPGVGYGGSCFPKDLSAFISLFKDYSQDPSLLQSTQQINNLQPYLFIKKVLNKLGNLENKNLTLFGLSFKPDTDDIREAPSIKIIELLLKYKANINAYDPAANINIEKIFGKQIRLFNDPYKAANKSEALLLVTEWPEFIHLDFSRIKSLMKSANIFDGRNALENQKLKLQELGFFYQGIGINQEYKELLLV